MRHCDQMQIEQKATEGDADPYVKERRATMLAAVEQEQERPYIFVLEQKGDLL